MSEARHEGDAPNEDRNGSPVGSALPAAGGDGVTRWNAPLPACHTWSACAALGPGARAGAARQCIGMPDRILSRLTRSAIGAADCCCAFINTDIVAQIFVFLAVYRSTVSASASLPRSRALRQRYKRVRAPSSPAHAGVVTELWRVAPRRGPETGKPRFEDRTQNGPLSIGNCLGYQGTTTQADESVRLVLALVLTFRLFQA